ncbi:MAG TPA: polysaccharide deacetylase family protein [Nitrososphaera sp.]|nr:polysaccharide deacetylase family protein [Nitrososphaera sp.]
MKELTWLAAVLLFLPLSDAYGQNQEISQSQITSCNCVAFRLDDIQDYYLNQPQMRIIETFEERNASLTVGVIGNYIGYDIVLVNFLKEKIGSKHFSLDVANHGWNHEDFTVFSMQEQSDLMSKSNDKIRNELGVQPSVFITPFNRMNEDTLVAMVENGLHTVSANVTEDHPPFVRNVTGPAGVEAIYHFPSEAKTGDLNADDTEWLGSSHRDTMREINDSIDKFGYAVVTMHPQEYSVREGTSFQNIADSDQLGELDLLLDSVDAEGYEIVTISELPNHATVPEFSSYLLMAVVISIAISCMYGLSGKLGALFRK